MFRALSVLNGQRKEGFADHSDFVKKQTKTFTKTLPNAFLTDTYPTATQKINMSKESSVFSLGTWDVETRQATTRDIDLDNYAVPFQLSPELRQKQAVCQAAPLEQLAASTNYNEKIRCGWIYEKGTPGYAPKVSKGALGTVRGPVGAFAKENPKGTWYWNLKDALKAVETDTCDSLVGCASVGQSPWNGCGYSDPSKGGTGRGVPVTRTGQVKYGNELGAPPQASVLLSPAQCPPPPPPGSPAAQAMLAQNACALSPDGRLTNACTRELLVNAGCKMDGSLYKTMYDSWWNSGNMLVGIEEKVPFQKYQYYAGETAKLPSGALKDGSIGQEVALASFKELATAAKQTAPTALSFAARDLCLKKGEFDKFDFCLELTDQSIGPFRLECMQREFRKAGGQPSGTLYPTEKNRTTVWGKFNTWREFKEAVANLASQTRTADEVVQRTALNSFIGIQREAKPDQIGSVQGLELIWLVNNTFVGRRILAGNSAQFPSLVNQKPTVGQIPDLQSGGNTFYVTTNVRPPSDMSIRVATQGRQAIVYNLDYVIDEYRTKGMVFDTTRAIGANILQPFGLKQTGSQCWKLRAGGPNYIMGFWENTFGGNLHQFTYSDCSSTAADKPIPAEWLTLTQEPDAPMLSWEGVGTFMGQSPFFAERRFPFALAIATSAQTRIVAPGLQVLKYPAVLQLRTTMGSGFASTFRNIATNSWRTVTCTFLANFVQNPNPCGGYGRPSADKQLRLYNADECNALNGIWHGNGECSKPQGGSYSWDCRDLNTNPPPKLLSLGPLNVYLSGRTLIITWNSGSLSVQYSFPNAVQADGVTPNYIAVTMRSDYAGRYPSSLSVVCGTTNYLKTASWDMSSTGQGTASFSTPDQSPLYSSATDGTQLILGDVSSVNSAFASIASVRLFDYSMEREDILRDIDNNWKMAFPQV
jgi:hypothetical protein